MKCQKVCRLTVIFVLILSFAACSATPNGTENMSEIEVTVENIFTQPVVETIPHDTIPEETTVPVQPPKQPTMDQGGMGSINMGPGGVPLMDEIGPYRMYEGGELHMPYTINATGSVADQGVGILLFLDGRPQPYKTAENDTYQYMHTFYPISGEEYIADISFIPVTGQAGDTLELYAATILNPDFSIKEGITGFVYTAGSVVSGTRLKYDATPSSGEYELTDNRIVSLASSYVDTKFTEISGWSDMDLMEKVEAHLYVNGVDDIRDCIVYGVTAEENVTIRYEVWGSPYVHYGLVIFIDNEPVFTKEDCLISVDVQNGKKTVIEAELDMTGFDGESEVYVMLVPRNYRTSEILTQAFLNYSRTFFLISDEK